VIIQLETDQSTAGGGQTSNAANASSNNSIDESYVRLHGGFGDLRMGSTKNASNVMATMAPSVGITSSNDGDASNVIIKPSSVSVGTDTLLGTSDDMKIAYYTPVFSGFQVGASLTPSNSEADTMPAVGGTAGTDTQEYNIALGYLSKLGGVDVSADVSYSEIHGEVASSSKGWRAGINLGFGNVVVGGSYRDTSELDSLVAGTSSSPEETSFDAGITYSSGPWAVGINYLSVSAPLATSTPGDDAATQIFLGASYSLGPGVDLLGNVFRATWEDESSADSANNDGWGALAGISVSF
jgi:outer membrane protein OmpU